MLVYTSPGLRSYPIDSGIYANPSEISAHLDSKIWPIPKDHLQNMGANPKDR